MSLLRLLTTGKTLVGLKKLEQRYRLPAEAPLPTFGGKTNPFRATAFPEHPQAVEPCAAEAAGDSPRSGVAPVEVAKSYCPTESKETVGQVSAPAREDARIATVPVDACVRQPAGRPSALRALLLWGRAKKSKGQFPASTRPLVQAELSLDSVKVVRNDLSESDLEVVPAGTAKAATEGEKQAVSEVGMGIPESMNGRATAQLAEASKM